MLCDRGQVARAAALTPTKVARQREKNPGVFHFFIRVSAQKNLWVSSFWKLAVICLYNYTTCLRAIPHIEIHRITFTQLGIMSFGP